MGFFHKVFIFGNQSTNRRCICVNEPIRVVRLFYCQTLTSKVKVISGAHSFAFTSAPTVVFQPTFVAIVRYFAQVDEVRSDGHVVDFVRVSDLDLDALAERREELREDDLLVPNGFVAALLDRRLPLKTHDAFYPTNSKSDQNFGDQSSSFFCVCFLKLVSCRKVGY